MDQRIPYILPSFPLQKPKVERKRDLIKIIDIIEKRLHFITQVRTDLQIIGLSSHKNAQEVSAVVDEDWNGNQLFSLTSIALYFKLLGEAYTKLYNKASSSDSLSGKGNILLEYRKRSFRALQCAYILSLKVAEDTSCKF